MENFSVERRKVVVSVPATTANIGSGYDCIGMAVDLWNEITLERSDKFEITAEGEGIEDIPMDETNLVVRGVKEAFIAANKPLPPLKYHLIQRIPHGRGLGSSSAAIVSGILAGLAIAGHKLEVQGTEAILQIATKMEGHPDNVAPAIYGGIQLGILNNTENRWETERLRLPPGLKFVMFIPDFVGKTEELRKVVPKTIPLEEAVFNMGRLAWFINALNTNKVHHFKEGLRDKLHQPHRGKAAYPHLDPMMDAAYEAGAVGAFLSGAGPVVMAITSGGSGDYFTQKGNESDLAVGQAMQKVADKLNITGRVYITHPSDTGGVITYADPPFSSQLFVSLSFFLIVYRHSMEQHNKCKSKVQFQNQQLVNTFVLENSTFRQKLKYLTITFEYHILLQPFSHCYIIQDIYTLALDCHHFLEDTLELAIFDYFCSNKHLNI